MTAMVGVGGNKRMQKTQAQVDEVVGIMTSNVEKVMDRDAKIAQLDDRADALQEGASQFEKSANAVRSKSMCKNMTMVIFFCVILLCIIVIVIISVNA